MEKPVDGIALNLGSGRIRWPGWTHVDLEGADLNCDLRAIPLPDNHASVACAIHVIEHFYQWEAKSVLTEWLRVLKPGGKLILELPCMDKILRYIHKEISRGAPLTNWMTRFAFWGDPKYQSVAMCHKWGYTLADITALMTSAGFVDVHEEPAHYHFPDERDMRIVGVKP